jgi:hypothetical protein
MNKNDDTETNPSPLYKKSICEIRGLEKIPKEVIKQLQTISEEEKNEIIKELIGSYNYLLTFYKNAQNNI